MKKALDRFERTQKVFSLLQKGGDMDQEEMMRLDRQGNHIRVHGRAHWRLLYVACQCGAFDFVLYLLEDKKRLSSMNEIDGAIVFLYFENFKRQGIWGSHPEKEKKLEGILKKHLECSYPERERKIKLLFSDRLNECCEIISAWMLTSEADWQSYPPELNEVMIRRR